jgi:hypothetical protein
MLDHVICFKADLDEATDAELMRRLATLATVPGVEAFALGKNYTDRSRGFDYCMRITFADRAALDAYQENELHLDVVRYNRSVTTEHIAFDFEWEPGPVAGPLG